MRAKYGFTLVEMMVVVGCLMLLVAIAIPDLLKTRQKIEATKELDRLEGKI